MKKVKKLMGNIPRLSMALLMLVMLGLAYFKPVLADAPADTSGYGRIQLHGDYELENKNNATSVVATYAHGTATITGTGLYSDGNSVVYGTGNISINCTPDNNYHAEIWQDGNSTHNSTLQLNLSAGDFTQVDPVFEEGIGVNEHAAITYNYNGERAEFNIDDSRFNYEQATAGAGNTDTAGSYTGTLDYGYDGSGTVTLNLETLFISRITSLVVNGTEYKTSQGFLTTPAQILNAIDGQTIHYSVEVPYSDSYTISTTTADNTGEYMTVGNFLWSYMDKDKGTDDYVGHGIFELVNVHYNNTDYSLQDIQNAHLGYLSWNEWENNETHQMEGGAMLPAGATLTVRLIPDAGYQLTSFTINGGEFEAGDDDHVGIYTFEVPRGNFHLGAHFTKVNNEVDTEDADAIVSGSIKLGGQEESMQTGTAKLGISNVELEPAKISNFKEAAGDYKVKTYLDISLFNTIYKGTANESWDKKVDELTNKATITLKLADDVDGNEIVIVHEKHDGTYEIIPTVYDPVKHTITFTTDSFSNYAIASKTVQSALSTSNNSSSNPKTGDDIYTYFIILGSSILGLTLLTFYRRKNSVM